MPKLPDHRTTIRFKPDEYALLLAKAGNKPLSVFLRELALDKAAELRFASKPTPIKDHKSLSQILAILGQCDLVLAFKYADLQIQNGIEPAEAETKQLLLDCKELLIKIHRLLMCSLGVSER